MAGCLSIQDSPAQLVDETQVSPTVPGGTIGKSLEEQVGAGRGNVATPQSSVYLIKRDPARSIRRGRQLFQRKFTTDQGLGPRVNSSSRGDIVQNPAFGAGLVDSCAGCHGRPRGAAGHGGVVNTRPDSRDAPHLFGLGLQEMLADEMTTELRRIETEAAREAARRGRPVRKRLRAKGIRFGSITVSPDGEVDTTRIEGVDSDLRVRPFFAHGGSYAIREFIVGAFKDEMGLECTDPDMTIAAGGGQVTTPSGMKLDGSTDKLNAPPIADVSTDGDADGVTNEIDPAVVDHLEFYLLNYFKPGTGKSSRRTEMGLKHMKQMGCTSCHTQNLTIDNDRRVADVETVFDPERGIYNRLFATATPLFEVQALEEGQEYPQLLPKGEKFVMKNIFSDLKRHDLGKGFWERQYDGSLIKEMVTEPLWGVGTTAPYGHDGRSINLEEVILRHGGEAKRSRERFARAPESARDAIPAYLNTLVLFPPDDTASNLNPGSPGKYSQDPAAHGTINLGALFQIPDPNGLGE